MVPSVRTDANTSLQTERGASSASRSSRLLAYNDLRSRLEPDFTDVVHGARDRRADLSRQTGTRARDGGSLATEALSEQPTLRANEVRTSACPGAGTRGHVPSSDPLSYGAFAVAV